MRMTIVPIAALVVLATLVASAPAVDYGSWTVRRWTIDVPSMAPSREGFEDVFVPDERIEISLPSVDGKAQLVVFHQMHELQVYIKWNEFIDCAPTGRTPHDITVESWYDDGTGRREDWTVANSMQAIFYPGLVNLLLRDLADAHQFKVRIVPFGADYLVQTFDVTGMAAALHELDGHYDYIKTRNKPTGD